MRLGWAVGSQSEESTEACDGHDTSWSSLSQGERGETGPPGPAGFAGPPVSISVYLTHPCVQSDSTPRTQGHLLVGERRGRKRTVKEEMDFLHISMATEQPSLKPNFQAQGRCVYICSQNLLAGPGVISLLLLHLSLLPITGC